MNRLTSLARFSTVRASSTLSAPRCQIRSFSKSAFSEKEDAVEKDWVTRQEKETLAKLLNKINKADDPDLKKQTESLNKILTQFRVPSTPDLIKALTDWKASSSH